MTDTVNGEGQVPEEATVESGPPWVLDSAMENSSPHEMLQTIRLHRLAHQNAELGQKMLQLEQELRHKQDAQAGEMKALTENAAQRSQDFYSSELVKMNLGMLVILLVCAGFGFVMVRSYIRRQLWQRPPEKEFPAPPLVRRPPEAEALVEEAVEKQQAAYTVLLEPEMASAEAGRVLQESPEAYFREGVGAIAHKEYDRAIELLSMAVKLNANYAEGFFNRGAAYAFTGEHAKAVADFNRTLDLRPGQPEAVFNRGLSFLQLKEYEVAAADFDVLATRGMANPGLYGYRATAYFKLGRYGEAIRDYSLSLQLRPAQADLHVNRGLALMKLGNAAEAEADFRAALFAQPDLHEAGLHLAASLVQQEKTEDAVQALIAAFTGNPRLVGRARRNGALTELLKDARLKAFFGPPIV